MFMGPAQQQGMLAAARTNGGYQPAGPQGQQSFTNRFPQAGAQVEQPEMQASTPVAGFRPKRPVDNSLPTFGLGLSGQGMNTMGNLGDLISQGFGHANTLSSMNRQAQYGPEAAMRIANTNNEGENYRASLSAASKLASLGLLGKMLGGLNLGGGGMGGNPMMGFKSLDSSQFAGF